MDESPRIDPGENGVQSSVIGQVAEVVRALSPEGLDVGDFENRVRILNQLRGGEPSTNLECTKFRCSWF